MVKITNEQLVSDVVQLQALTNGIAVSHGTAIMNLQNVQVNQQAELDGHQITLDDHETRIATLEVP